MHCDDENITQISDFSKGVYYRETHKHMKNKNKIMAGSTDVLFVFNIRTRNLTKQSSNFLRIHNHVQNHSYEEIS